MANINVSSKLMEKMWDSLFDKGIGGLLKPWQMRREAKASIDIKTEEMLKIAQAERLVKEIHKGNLSIEHDNNIKLISHDSFGESKAKLDENSQILNILTNNYYL